MGTYNFLSGSSIDNSNNLFLDALESGQCYLGFSKGSSDNQWGVNALISIEISSGLNFPSQVMANNSISANRFFDYNTVNTQYVPGSVITNTFVDLYSYNDNIAEVLYTNLNLVYMNKDWVLIKGIPNDSAFRNKINTDNTSVSYYLKPSDSTNNDRAVKIIKKSYQSFSSIIQDCKLIVDMQRNGMYSNAITGIQKSTNILGETYVSGVKDENGYANILENYNSVELSGFEYKLVSTNGSPIIDNLSYVIQDSSSPSNIYNTPSTIFNAEKYLLFTYNINGINQYLKFLVGSKDNNEYAIWHESLPFTSVVPVADANPPSLDVSYLKNPTIASSIFDINGITKINPEEIKYVKEMLNVSMKNEYDDYGFSIETLTISGDAVQHTGTVSDVVQSTSTTIPLFPFHNFVVGDIITISNQVYTITNISYNDDSPSIDINPQLVSPLSVNTILYSASTNIKAVITLATTDDKTKALKYGCDNVMITKSVPLTGINSPTESIYRQLFVCYKPKDSNGDICTEDIYNNDSTDKLFNEGDWSYNIGTLLYLANKIPVFRKYITGDNETFKIIL